MLPHHLQCEQLMRDVIVEAVSIRKRRKVVRETLDKY